MTSGFVLGSAYGFHGSAAVIKASGEDTLGQLGVIESVYPAGLSVHEHVHDGEDEMDPPPRRHRPGRPNRAVRPAPARALSLAARG
jgi:hypothetical protein